jgi:hypothetical protein
MDARVSSIRARIERVNARQAALAPRSHDAHGPLREEDAGASRMREREASKSLTLCLASKTVRAVASPATNKSESKRPSDRGFLRSMRLSGVRVILAAMALGGLAVVVAMGACDESTPLPSALPPADLVAPDAAPDGPADAASAAQSSDGGNPSVDASPAEGASDAPAFVDESADGAPESEAASDQAPDADVDAPDESSLSTDDGGPPSAPDAGDS